MSDLVSPAAVGHLASSSNARHGRELLKSNEVEVTSFEDSQVTFRVGGTLTGRRSVELRSSEEGLHWTCTCTSDPDLFCKHLVAAALSLDVTSS